jgi:methyl-accepting chemotaxis protein PixJ
MATPESLKDPIEGGNGHKDYSESISDLLSDLDDLDLSEIFGSNSSDPDLLGANLLMEMPFAEEQALEQATESEEAFVAENLVTKVKEPDLISFEPEVNPISTEITDDSDRVHSETTAVAFDVSASNTEFDFIHSEAESIRFEMDVEPTETLVEQDPEQQVPEQQVPESRDFQSEIINFEEAANSEEIANFESENIESKVESTRFEEEVKSVETAEQVPELSSLEQEATRSEAEDSKTEIELTLAAATAQSAEGEVVQASEPIMLEAESVKAEIEPVEVEASSLENMTPFSAATPAVTQPDAKLVSPIAANASKGAWYKRLNLRTKATLLAIAIGTLPVIATGTLAYFSTSPEVKEAAIAKQESRLTEASDLVGRFMFERYGDVQILSNLPIFANRKGTANVTEAQKQSILDKYIKIYGVYDSIAEFDLDGNVLVQSSGYALSNHKDWDYFQAVLKTQKPFISQPQYSKSSLEFVVYFAAPVFDVETGKMIAIVRSRMPVKSLDKLAQGVKSKEKSAANLQKVSLIDVSGQYFISKDLSNLGEKVERNLSIFPRFNSGKKLATAIYNNSKEKTEELVSYSPMTQLEGMPELNWSVLVASETKESFTALNNLRLSLIAGTAMAALLVGAAAAFLANRATRPIIDSAEAVKRIGRGELDTRVSVSGQDELAELGTNINTMAEQLQSFLTQQEEEARGRQLLTEISQARAPQALEAPLNTLLAEIRETMQLDRAVVYRFYPNWSGHIVGESVLPGWPVALADKIEDACIPQALLDAYKKGRVVPTRDVFDAGFHPDHLELMKRLKIKANLVVPILQGEELFGILVAHHCAKTHDWQQSEIEYLQEAASKMGAPMGSLALFERQEYEAEQERNRSQGLQMELMNLLGDVQGASDGDLTVRADVSAGEIGIVADFFNSIVENLRDIVSQVKDASAQVNTSVGNNEVAMDQLAEESQVQAQQITNTLKSVEQMALSIQEVAENARKAAKVAGIASSTAESGGKTMDRTVDSILQLRETVAETSKKVKRLGESSQQISKAVSLINQIALQTNLLAINASIEAARAGKEGRGFAVVAEEVGSLAAQSAEATKEIEQIVENIQTETGEVVDAMERGTTQVVEGTRQVEEAKESLQQIVKVSRQIDKLLQSISSATVSQTEASEVVKQLMQQVTQSSERASDTSRQVSGSLQETVAIAQQLQASVGAFKVEN